MRLVWTLAERFGQSHFIRYIISGGTASAVVIIGFHALNTLQFFAPIVSSFLAFSVGHVLNYILQYYFTFRSTEPHAHAFARFMGYSTLTIGLNLVLFHFFSAIIHDTLAQAASLIVIFIINFFINKTLTFKSRA